MVMSTRKATQAKQNNGALWYNLSDANFQLFLNQFGETCSKYEQILGIDAGELEEIQDASTDFAASFATMITARTIAEGATATKNDLRESSTNTVRKFVAQIQGIPNLPDEVYAELQIPKRGTVGQRGAAITVSDVAVIPGGVGEVILKFNRNGNPASATFTIQQFVGTSWVNVASGSKTRYKLQGYPAGVPATFRVITARGTSISTPSYSVTVWDTEGSGSNELSIAA